MLIMLGWFVVAEVENGGLIKLYVKASVDSITSPQKYFASQLVQQLNTQRTKPRSEPTDKHQNVLYTILLSCPEEKISASHPEFQIFHCSVSQWAFNLQVLWLFPPLLPSFQILTLPLSPLDSFVYETEHFNGVAELLEILGRYVKATLLCHTELSSTLTSACLCAVRFLRAC